MTTTEDDAREPNIEPWNVAAAWWRDEFTDGADPEYEEQIIPLLLSQLGTPRHMLDVGTGEGQIARAAIVHGARAVTGVDASSELIDTARRRAGGPSFVEARADRLPFEDKSFDAAVACLVFEHVPDVATVVAEIARVLEPGASFLLFLNHPLLQTPGAGWIDDHILDEQYWRIGSYLGETRTVEEVQKDLFIPFFHRPLSHYLNVLITEGFELREVQEPPPAEGFTARSDAYDAAKSIPRLLFLRLEKTHR